MSFIRECPEGLRLKVFILPRSSKNMVVGVYKDALKIKLTAPPVDGAANRMCIKFISKYFHVSKSSLEIISGSTSRTKTVFLRCKNSVESSMQKKRIKTLAESIFTGDQVV